MDAITHLLRDNVLVIGITAVVLVVGIYLFGGQRKHAFEPPYVYKGIPLLGNFIEFAKGEFERSASSCHHLIVFDA